MAYTASGAATGGIISSLIVQQLLPRMGFAWTARTMAFAISFNAVIVISVPCLTDPPLAGALIETYCGGFLFAQTFGGSAFTGGTLTLIAARIAKSGLNFKSRI